MDPTPFADSAVKVLRALTWKRVGMVGALVAIGIVAGIAWVDREYLAKVVQPAKLSLDTSPLEITPEGKKAVDAAIMGRLISTVGVVSVNAPENTRKIVYFKSSDENITAQYTRTVSQFVTRDVPLISQNAKDNEIVIRLLNGELVCRPWAESISSKYLKDVDVKFVCSVGVPPSYGRFRGIVMVFIRVVPNEDEEHRIRILLRKLSLKLDDPGDAK